MANFVIPKGKDYTFTVRVMEKDSFLPQDLKDMESATFELLNLDTMCNIGGVVIGTRIANPLNLDSNGDPIADTQYTKGMLQFDLDSVYTGALEFARGDKVDGYYLKPTYTSLITVTFTAASGITPITAMHNKVYVSPTGCA